MKNVLGVVQMVCGFCSAVTVGSIYLLLNSHINKGVGEIRAVAARVSSEIKVATQLVEEVEGATGDVLQLIENQRVFLGKTDEAVVALESSISQWEKQIKAFSEVAEHFAVLIDATAKQLPLRMPLVELIRSSQTLSFPELQPKPRKLSIPYYSISISNHSVKISYPKELDFEKREIRYPGGSFKYPHSAKIEWGNYELTYPSRARVYPRTMDIEILDAELVEGTRVVEVIVPKISFTEVLREEGHALANAAQRVSSISQSLIVSSDALRKTRDSLRAGLRPSLASGMGVLDKLANILMDFHRKKLPVLKNSVRDQAESVDELRNLLLVVPRGFQLICLLGILLSLGMMASGLAKFRT